MIWYLSKYNWTPPSAWGFVSEVHLDIGCGSNPRNPFAATNLIAADILDEKSLRLPSDFKYLQLATDGKIPLPDGFVDSISGYDFIEHLPRAAQIPENQFIKFMNEAHRVLKPGGVMLAVTPAYPSPAAFQDPTHVNFISTSTVWYFTGTQPPAREMGYGFNGRFDLVAQFWIGPFSQIWIDSKNTEYQTGFRVFQKSLLNNFYPISNFRRTLSILRNPTHLVWLLRKI